LPGELAHRLPRKGQARHGAAVRIHVDQALEHLADVVGANRAHPDARVHVVGVVGEGDDQLGVRVDRDTVDRARQGGRLRGRRERPYEQQWENQRPCMANHRRLLWQNARSECAMAGSSSVTNAATRLPATIDTLGRPSRSVRKPPSGTESIVSQIARLTMKPASASVAPRAIKRPGPNAMMATRLALKHPQAKPPLVASPSSRPERRARRSTARPAVSGGSR